MSGSRVIVLDVARRRQFAATRCELHVDDEPRPPLGPDGWTRIEVSGVGVTQDAALLDALRTLNRAVARELGSRRVPASERVRRIAEYGYCKRPRLVAGLYVATAHAVVRTP